MVLTLEERQKAAGESIRARRKIDGDPPSAPTKIAKVKPYVPSQKMKDKYCEVCLVWDPYVLDSHHIEPRERGTRQRRLGIEEKIILCANCHVKCHRLFGGVSGRPYHGPTIKDQLIRELRNERYKYSGKNPYVKISSVRIPSSKVNKIIKEYNAGGISMRKLAAKHNVSRAAVYAFIKDGHNGVKTRLRIDQIDTIRKASLEGASNKLLATEYGVAPVTIRRIISGKTWNSSSKLSVGSSWRVCRRNATMETVDKQD